MFGFLLCVSTWGAVPQDTLPKEGTLQEVEIIANNIEANTIRLKTLNFGGVGQVGGSIEGLVRSLAGVAGSDELSSQYSVRGGNFDENLLIINGFEVYRPQLARSGQQEGLSAINPDFVQFLAFSAGGFDASKGDKLSSVLDVQYRSRNTYELPGHQIRAGLFSGRLFTSAVLDRDGRNGKVYQSLAVGLRYRSNAPFIRGGDVAGDLRSDAQDVQFLFESASLRWFHEVLGIAQTSTFALRPSSRTTEFGTVTEVLRLNVYMNGIERYQYQNAFVGARSRYALTENQQAFFESSVAQALEQEDMDVESAYLLGEVNNNLGSDAFGEISYLRGSGGHQRYARNQLWVREWQSKAGYIYKGDGQRFEGAISYRHQDGLDLVHEWVNLDSAGYSLPHQPTAVRLENGDTVLTTKESLRLFQVTDSRGHLVNGKVHAHVLWQGAIPEVGWKPGWNAGLRYVRDSRSGEQRLSPRLSLFWSLPSKLGIELSAGSYAQTASVRELRDWSTSTFLGNARMQHAWHAIAAVEKQFTSKGRPFFWRGEAYLKYLDRAFPFEQDGMRVRYLGEGPGIARVVGIDNRIHSEWLPGTESWASLSLFRAQERFGASWTDRGSDYRYSFSMRVEDALPDNLNDKVYMQINVTGGFPFGAPLSEDKDFRSPPYRRMDLGFQHDFGPKASLGLEVFNLLEIRNTASYFWIMDISTARQYAVPNYLTNRLVNLIFTYRL